MKRKTVGLVIFLIGFAILIYPLFSQTYYDYVYRLEVEEIHEEFEENQEFSDRLYQQQINYNQGNVSDLDEIEIANVGFVESEQEPEEETDFMNETILGSLSIPAIDLTYPIYDGASDENLNKGLARLHGTSYPVGGINTNSVIAGHSSFYGKTYFSKITNLVEGDLVYIQNRGEQIVYEVYATAIIEPTDISALAIVPGQDIITLLTCTMPPPGTHRYLVYAKRVQNEEVTTTTSTTLETTVATENEASETSITTQNNSVSTSEITTVSATSDVTETSTSQESSENDGMISTFMRRNGLLIGSSILAIVLAYFIFIRDRRE